MFDFSLCTRATLSLKFFCMELSCTRLCSIANKWKGLSLVADSFKLRKFRCKIATKKKKTDILKNIISQSFDKDTPNDNIETVMNDLKGGEKDFSMKEVCIFAEFISRYYENILKGNKPQRL